MGSEKDATSSMAYGPYVTRPNLEMAITFAGTTYRSLPWPKYTASSHDADKVGSDSLVK